jgi:adenylate kinase
MCRHCGGALRRRVDDDDTVVAERLRQYHRQTEPLLDYYRVRPTFRPVDGTRAPSEVTRDLANAIDACRAGVGPGGGPACRPLN